MSHPISSFGPYLRPRRRFTFALVALLTAAGLCGCGNRWTTPIGGRWEIVTVQSGIPEAGDHYSSLQRHSRRVNVTVDDGVVVYRFVPPDSVVWRGLNNDAFWIATGDHQPLLLQGGVRGSEPLPAGDVLDLGPLGQHRLTDLAQRAAHQPPLTPAWRPPARPHASPTTLPDGGVQDHLAVARRIDGTVDRSGRLTPRRRPASSSLDARGRSGRTA